MKQLFNEFYNTVKKDRLKSSYSKADTLENRFSELKKEIEELGQALKNNDNENFKEELGDSIWNLFFMITIAEEKNLFTGKDVLKDVIEKFSRRKPYIFGDKIQTFTTEEEISIWKDIKKQEKENQL